MSQQTTASGAYIGVCVYPVQRWVATLCLCLSQADGLGLSQDPEGAKARHFTLAPRSITPIMTSLSVLH